MAGLVVVAAGWDEIPTVSDMESLMAAKLVDDLTDSHSDKTRESWGVWVLPDSDGTFVACHDDGDERCGCCEEENSAGDNAGVGKLGVRGHRTWLRFAESEGCHEAFVGHLGKNNSCRRHRDHTYRELVDLRGCEECCDRNRYYRQVDDEQVKWQGSNHAVILACGICHDSKLKLRCGGGGD